jgi:hypothetical protein
VAVLLKNNCPVMALLQGGKHSSGVEEALIEMVDIVVP